MKLQAQKIEAIARALMARVLGANVVRSLRAHVWVCEHSEIFACLLIYLFTDT